MRSFAVIGLGRFGECVLESLSRRRCDIVVVDREENKIQRARDVAMQAVRADAVDVDMLRELLPDGLECAIVDLGDEMERSILVTNYLHKLGIPNIIVEAVNLAHAEILQIVGATRIIFPEREAAERLVGSLAGRGALDFFPVSDEFSLIEVKAPAAWVDKPLSELDLRNTHGVTVVATRKEVMPDESEQWRLAEPTYRFAKDDVLLLAGKPAELQKVQS